MFSHHKKINKTIRQNIKETKNQKSELSGFGIVASLFGIVWLYVHTDVPSCQDGVVLFRLFRLLWLLLCLGVGALSLLACAGRCWLTLVDAG